MDGLFSHAEPFSTSGQDSRPTPPARVHSVRVPVPADQAFEGFIDYVHLWWPVGTFSALGPGSHVGFENDGLVEESDDGRVHLWGTIERVEPPNVLELSFTLGMERHPATRVRLDVQSVGPGAEVTLTHDGWSDGDAGQEQYEKYSQWPEILSYYARFMGGHS